MVSHTREKKFSCQYCNKSFGLKHNMKTHQKIHEGGGHHCGFCDRTFSQSNILQGNLHYPHNRQDIPYHSATYNFDR